jgi:hypothetical protein
MIKARNISSGRFDKLSEKKPSRNADDLSEEEGRARSLIRDISNACAELRNIAYNAGGDEQKNKLIEVLTQNISTHRSKLESTTATLTRYMRAAESNIRKLESQCLNDPDSDISLQRAAGGARSELKRLAKLLDEIEQVLFTSGSAGNGITRIRNSGEDNGDFRFEPTSRDARGTDNPPSRDRRGGHAETGTLKPLLGQAAHGGLSESLKKIPIAAQGTSKIQAGIYKGGVYIENAHFNNLQMSVSSQGSPASSNRNGISGESSLSQKGGDGSYMAGGDMGVFSPTQKNDFGIW